MEFFILFHNDCLDAGGMLCTLIMSKILKIHDSIIGTFAGFMDTLAAIGFFFAVTDWQIYAGIFHTQRLTINLLVTAVI